MAFPDAELIVGRYLRDKLGTTASVVLTLAPDQVFTPPVVRVNRIGGNWRVHNVLDEPMIDIDVWGETAEAAKSVIHSARTQCAALRGLHYLGAAVTHVYEVAGPGRRPEDDSALTRWGFTIGLLLHPVT